MKRTVSKAREAVDLATERHLERREFNAATDKGGIVLEDRIGGAVLKGYGADPAAPQVDLGQGAHVRSPQRQGAVLPARWVLGVEARWRVLPRSFSCSIGLIGVSGRSWLSPSRRSRARRTRIRLVSWLEAPPSSRSRVLLETPACLATCAWVRLRSSRARSKPAPSSTRSASSVSRGVNRISRRLCGITSPSDDSSSRLKSCLASKNSANLLSQ